MLGDIAIAEPGAMIGFAGARVIEETIREKLPEGFQRAEYLLEHGMVDMVVPRKRAARDAGPHARLLIAARAERRGAAICPAVESRRRNAGAAYPSAPALRLSRR